MSEKLWTDTQFDEMSWHDNHVHALRIVETAHGQGDLILDIDHIVEWIKGEGGGFNFRILPAVLTFHGVTFLRMSLDYATPTAAFGPFMIHGIERRSEQLTHYIAQLWKIAISWPLGDLSFEAHGFTQRARGQAILSAGQCLNPAERNSAI